MIESIRFDAIAIDECSTLCNEQIKNNQSKQGRHFDMSERPAAESDVSGENGFINNINMEKHVRYDRGIRIWGHHGQAALEDARVCLLHCSATGSEALKNVVLGGINSFVIVDDYIIEEEDLGNNFMVTSTSIGKSRAQVVTGESRR